MSGQKLLLIFKENSYFAQSGLNRAFLGPKKQKYKHFTKSVHKIFPKFYVMTGIQKEVRVISFCFIFQYKFACLRTPLWTFLATIMASFMFLVIVLVLKTGIHCYLVLVIVTAISEAVFHRCY